MCINLLLALCMEVNALDCSSHLVETNVIEAFEACAVDCSDTVIRHQEILLPPHEKMLLLHPVLCDQFWT